MKEVISPAPRDGPDAKPAGTQVNQYDKILKENMEAVLPALMKDLLGIHAVETQELPKYELPVRQYVIYLGEGLPHMKDQIRSENLQFRFRIVTLSAIDYRSFLSADTPEGRLLAILGNFGNNDRLRVVKTIVKEVIAGTEDGLSKERRLRQLVILSNLRKRRPLFDGRGRRHRKR